MYRFVFVLALSDTVMGQSMAAILNQSSTNVCLSIPAYAELELPQTIELMPVSESENGAAKRYRAVDTIQIEANVPVQIIADKLGLSGDGGAFNPNIYIGSTQGQAFLDYDSGPQSLELRVDVNLPPSEIQQAGEYTGQLNLVVMADLGVSGCY